MANLNVIVFSMSADSALGPDGFSCKFFHVCWSIINQDILKAINFFPERGD